MESVWYLVGHRKDRKCFFNLDMAPSYIFHKTFLLFPKQKLAAGLNFSWIALVIWFFFCLTVTSESTDFKIELLHKRLYNNFHWNPSTWSWFSVGIGDQRARRDITQWFSKCGTWNNHQHQLECVRYVHFQVQSRPVDSETGNGPSHLCFKQGLQVIMIC